MNQELTATVKGEVANLPLPLNAEDPLFAPYLSALANGELLIRQCAACDTQQWPPRPFCRNCQSSDFIWVQVLQTGTIASFSIAYRAFHPGYLDRLPAGTVLVDVEPGIRIAGRWTGKLDEIKIGARAELVVDEWAKHGVSAAWAPPQAK
ncbi:Zn-ribbon domain-containing OB-fold protein [Brevibacterium spongiae]|uniref:Zinc ribbon domain-containing protein n=1 Tax=Brevibacterium spongiae TaxID=2909672 RepID=A0ABY5STE6_9MICO|nr:zinc ribbon domain-containing protein [Brevibacterium spongiae]UVI36423.1 zinc ribbon domain-containing protein [Brevibacterium spongiae]